MQTCQSVESGIFLLMDGESGGFPVRKPLTFGNPFVEQYAVYAGKAVVSNFKLLHIALQIYESFGDKTEFFAEIKKIIVDRDSYFYDSLIFENIGDAFGQSYMIQSDQKGF